MRRVLRSLNSWAVAVMLIDLLAVTARAQSWNKQESHTTADLRGVSVVSKSVAWASGAGGTVLRTISGGETWVARTVPGAEQLDFRDVEAFDERNAVLLAIGPGEKSRIYKTTDGGQHWRLLTKNDDPHAFWDCMAWWDTKHGIVVGDPVNGNFQVMVTTNGGESWIQGDAPATPGEGAFAASGTCVAVEGQYRESRRASSWEVQARAWFASGGSDARVFSSTDAGATWNIANTPIPSGPASRGIFSIAFWNSSDGVVVGGDYREPALLVGNVALTRNGGRSWAAAEGVSPRGFRSAVAYDRASKLLVTVGTSGSDYSNDGGNSWQALDGGIYNALSFAPDGSGWAVGPKGRIAVWVGPAHKSRFRLP
ncbi:MAG TPA: hypothetical protein VKB56_12340 [Terriglobales bacterium]|nr:hypothetical protein [Terriglobales bacterium]